MRFTKFSWLAAFFLLTMVGITNAQTVDTIMIGEPKTGAVTASNAAPSFFFDASANQVLTVQLVTTSEAFRPVLLVADDANNVVETFSSPAGENVGGTLTIPADGRYFVQVQGSNGTQGEFTLTLLEGDIPINPPTPTEAAEATAESEVTAETDGGTTLQPGDRIQSTLDQAGTEHIYTFEAEDSTLIVQVQGGGGDTDFAVTLTSDTSGAVIGSYQAPVEAGAFVVPSSSGAYTLTVSHADTDPLQPYVVSLAAYTLGDSLAPEPVTPMPQATPTPSPTIVISPTPQATPTPLAPEDVDAILTWSASELMFTNVSGARLDLRMLSFTGDNRSVDMTFWSQSNPTLDLSAFPPDTCAGFRPLAYPDAPSFAPGCDDLAAWWSADIVHFWGGESFDVRYNGAVIATCQTSEGQCALDLSGA